jgi:hypothetical protein
VGKQVKIIKTPRRPYSPSNPQQPSPKPQQPKAPPPRPTGKPYYELPIAARIETTGGRRRTVREILAGVGMVTPDEPLTLPLDGGGWEVLSPGRDHLDPSHPAVRSRPELFRPCSLVDTPTVNRMLRALVRQERQQGKRDPYPLTAHRLGYPAPIAGHGTFPECRSARRASLRPAYRRTVLPGARGRGAECSETPGVGCDRENRWDQHRANSPRKKLGVARRRRICRESAPR